MRLFQRPFRPFCRHPPCLGGLRARLCRRQQLWQPHQIISRRCQGEHPTDAILSAMAGLAHSAAGLGPAEYLFDAFSDALTDSVAGVMGGTTIDGWASVR